ncbi:TPA: PepSY domain-containing protein [Burkholderia aenigmatica]|uniref:PepSY domain-containing protein n=1 Tax=Burkholderia TaxID=32008 RepID=UPI0007523938|nr:MULTISPECIES: PepSY domain-containing protein [Burkholderia]HDR9483035.1 PepSY domain-containing protein [Burkholderia aenigmatica]HEM7880855.1 PepSY domain-containing protein [Burkholderia contaminans]KVR69291.1 peptidase M4 [Burkholderia vietnamiensis]MDN7515898.1 PepSY domain-containing protein [Burkholderia sp. AU45251]HDR9513983.1 PepSY domain-containing protein [Burkholderia aenigmatica]
MNRYIKLSVLAALVATSAAAAYAANGNGENDAMSVVHAPVTLAQAVTAAERHVHGKAARAEYENSKQGWVYDVEVVSDGKAYDVRVDSNNGTILTSSIDSSDHDGHDALD